MDLELATLDDIVQELRRRSMRFVLVGIAPSNTKNITLQVGAAAQNTDEIFRLIRLGRNVLKESNDSGSADGLSES